MKKLSLSLVLLLFMAVTWAHSFTAVNADGKTIMSFSKQTFAQIGYIITKNG